MNIQDFRRAVKLIESGADLSDVTDFHLYGCTTREFRPVATTIEAAAKFIGYHARTFAGTWDESELENMRGIAQKKFLVVN